MTGTEIEQNVVERLEAASVDIGDALVEGIADEVVRQLRPQLEAFASARVQPALLDVKQAAVYLGRSEQAVQHLIRGRELPVVRKGRRVHLHRPDLDRFIEQNKA